MSPERNTPENKKLSEAIVVFKEDAEKRLAVATYRKTATCWMGSRRTLTSTASKL